MSATYVIREVGDVTIIDCGGRITIGQGAYGLRDTIRNLAKNNRKKVVLNLADTSYIDSVGLGELVSGFTSLSNCGATLKLLALSQKLKDLFTIIKIYTWFEVFDNEAEAVRSFD